MSKYFHRLSTRKRTYVQTIAVALSCVIASSVSLSPGYCQSGGQTIESTGGNDFMDEVIDPKEQQRRQEEMLRKPKLDRHQLSAQELQNLGVQVNSQGHIIPLIRRGAPPVLQQSSTVTAYDEPWWNFTPTVWGPDGPYPAAQFGTPFSQFGGWQPNFGGWQPNSMSPWNRPLWGPFGSPIMQTPWGGGYAPQFSLGFNSGMPSVSGPVNSYTNILPDGSTQISTSGSLLRGPFWNGFLGSGPAGNLVGGGSFTLPTVSEFDSTTTITPLIPQLPPPAFE